MSGLHLQYSLLNKEWEWHYPSALCKSAKFAGSEKIGKHKVIRKKMGLKLWSLSESA